MLIPDTKPRFKGCPPICETENLPSFESESALAEWKSKFTPGVQVIKVFQCGNHWHAHTVANGPSGESSGHGRYAKHKKKTKL